MKRLTCRSAEGKAYQIPGHPFDPYEQSPAVDRLADIEDILGGNYTLSDVVPVIRCGLPESGHCAHYTGGYCRLLEIHMDPCDYCSYGKRKECAAYETPDEQRF